MALADSPCTKRFLIYERALRSLPGSYKLWYAYLRDRLDSVTNLPITHSKYETLNNTFERSLVTMHKMPRIWIMYLQFLTKQKLVTRTRRAFDRALCALPVTQHDRIWELYLEFASQKGMPIETSLRVYRRYLKYDPTHIEDFIEFLVSSKLWQESAEKLASVLNDDQFVSIKGKTKLSLWIELCDLVVEHATEVTGLNVDAIIRAGIRKFKDDAGKLWTSLAEYYIRMNLPEKARDIFEEGIATVNTVKDFSVIWDSYVEFEQSLLDIKMETMDLSDDEDLSDEEEEEDVRLNPNLSKKKLLDGFWLQCDKDIDLRFARVVRLEERRPELASNVILRQNPHNVEQWHRRVKLFSGNSEKQIKTYGEAVKTVDPMKAVGKPHTLWVAFAKLYESDNDIVNARDVFDRAVQASYKSVDDLATVWCEWAEMELRNKNFQQAIELVKRATAEPSIEIKRRVYGSDEPAQMKLYKSLRLWSLYVDLEKSLGSIESARAVYESIIDLKIVTPQIIINYADFLEKNKYFEDSFRVYERGVKIFKYPHVKDIWETYLCKFVKRYGKSKLERARELFKHAIEMTPADQVKQLYLQYAKLEEGYGFAKRAMEVYDSAAKAVPIPDKLGMYEIYIARAAEIFGLPKTREIFEKAIESGLLPGKDVKTMCVKYAEVEKALGETDRARGIYAFASQFADSGSDDFWKKWHEFEVRHGNEDTFREMLRSKRSVSANYTPALERQLLAPQGSVTPALERQLLAPQGNTPAFVRGGRVEGTALNTEDIELPDEEEEQEEVVVKEVPEGVYRGSVRKRELEKEFEGARERFKRQKIVGH